MDVEPSQCLTSKGPATAAAAPGRPTGSTAPWVGCKNLNDQACIAVMRKSKITLPFMFTAYDEVPICTLASEAQTEAEEADGAVGMTELCLSCCVSFDPCLQI